MHLGSEEQTMTSFTNRRASLVITGLGVLTFLSAPLIPAMAGVVGGARVTNETIYARGSDVYHFTFRGGVPARVVAHADGEDIDMYVYDEGGHLITKDTLPDDTPVCTWTPCWTGSFTIKIKNCEDSDVRYAIRTN